MILSLLPCIIQDFDAYCTAYSANLSSRVLILSSEQMGNTPFSLPEMEDRGQLNFVANREM
jgi:hypothetical protein